MSAVTTVLFACVHNAGRSQMAATRFNALADPYERTFARRVETLIESRGWRRAT